MSLKEFATLNGALYPRFSYDDMLNNLAIFGIDPEIKNLTALSMGQKKKVLLARSLCTPAHLYIWYEPLNYIDVWSRMQIEELLLTCRPTMVLVEHDGAFRRKIATKSVRL